MANFLYRTNNINNYSTHTCFECIKASITRIIQHLILLISIITKCVREELWRHGSIKGFVGITRSLVNVYLKHARNTSTRRVRRTEPDLTKTELRPS